jgi:hypothetical protein
MAETADAAETAHAPEEAENADAPEIELDYSEESVALASNVEA